MSRLNPTSKISHKDVRIVEIKDNADQQRVDNYLLRVLKGVPRSRIYRMIRSGEVRVNKGRVKPTTRLVIGDLLRIPPVMILEPGEVPDSAVNKHAYLLDRVIYEDGGLLAINKPSGLAVHAGTGIAYGLIELLRKIHPAGTDLELCHRLDRETSGVLLISKKRQLNRYLNNLFKQKTEANSGIKKCYLALLKGRMKQTTKVEHKLYRQGKHDGERIVVVHPDGVVAASTFRPVSWPASLATLCEVDLHTGRTHQVRVHAQSMGCPVACDNKYGDKRFNRKMSEAGLNRLFLHAYLLEFKLPDNPVPLALKAEIPEDLDRVLLALQGTQ
ncbi:MAG: RluA family pseudouridine synthase [Arenicellaceae bacterium]|nr:RluA family pseudouridine synthase [Arenicellaceae bacterium]